MKLLVAGLQFGDEAKGKCSAHFCQEIDAKWSVKFNGANNAGHTVYGPDGKQHKFHYLTAGCLYGAKTVIDAGVALNLEAFKKEIEEVGIPIDLYISENVHLILPDHLEADKEGSKLGTTKKGVMYAYADRALRRGIRVTRPWLDEYEIDATIYRGLPPIPWWENAVYESSQAIMLDVDYGDYPFVTSSSIMPSMVHKIHTTIGVLKAYTTRVGDGPPFYEEVPGLSEKGAEYGVTTGRRRKSYWNDIDQLDYAISVVQPDEMVMTKIDILKDMSEIFVWKGGEKILIGNYDTYLNYMLERYPRITYLSDNPQGELIRL